MFIKVVFIVLIALVKNSRITPHKNVDLVREKSEMQIGVSALVFPYVRLTRIVRNFLASVTSAHISRSKRHSSLSGREFWYSFLPTAGSTMMVFIFFQIRYISHCLPAGIESGLSGH